MGFRQMKKKFITGRQKIVYEMDSIKVFLVMLYIVNYINKCLWEMWKKNP